MSGGVCTCDPDNVNACVKMGVKYEDSQNISKANELYERACDLGDAEGCIKIADLYYNGIEISQNRPKAYTFYEKACDLNHGWGCFKLGMGHAGGGDDIRLDRSKADFYLKRACDLGKEDACDWM